MYNQVRATAISIKPKKWDRQSNADKLERFVREAAKDSPDLIVTPEGVLEGYVASEVTKKPELAQQMLDIAEPIDGPYVDRFTRLARELETCLVFGFAERIGDEVYNAAVFIDDRGELCGRYHKTQLAEGTSAPWFFNRVGRTIRAFDTPLGRAGILICNDRWNPMIARTLVLDGAQMLLIPSYGMKTKPQNETVLARARENGVPVVEANVGVNMIVSKGEIVGYKWGNDQITTAVIDVPVWPSTAAAREYERQYMDMQTPEMERRYREWQKSLRGEQSLVSHARVGGLTAGIAE